MKTTEKQQLKKNIKRLGLFLLIVFLPILIVSIFLVPILEMWQNIIVLVVMLFVLFFLYSWVLQKLDRKKEERISKKKDPFSD
ncbi:MAG: hypothetical protein J6J24_01255 [Clostridia bacterium]|nr:hypothetical protein [Clostridia bacterium]